MVGHGFLEGFLAVNAYGRSVGVVVAWNKMVFTKVASKMGQFSVAVKLKRHNDDLEMVGVLIYGLVNVKRRTELWEELGVVAATFQGSPMLMGGDFNVTLEAKDRVNNAGGQDLDLEDFRSFITEAMLQEIGLVNFVYMWRSTDRYTLPSQLDRFLCMTELAEKFPLADVHLLPRPLFDYTPIVWTAKEGQGRFTYFKVDKSWVREVGFKEEVESAWFSQASQGSLDRTKRLADKIIGLWGNLTEFKKCIRDERSKKRQEVTMIKNLDNVEDRRI